MDSNESIIGYCVDIIYNTVDFINTQLDLVYLGWVMSLIYPTIIAIVLLPFFILAFLYFSALLLYIYQRREKVYDELHKSLEDRDPWAGGRYLIALVWDAHGYIWYSYEVQGLENIPEGPALLVYYHGALPIDVYYLVSRLIVTCGRHIICVGDKFLQKIPGWKSLIECFKIMPGSISTCVQVLNDGYLLSVSPGGVREAQFSDHNYSIVWGTRCGFAKVAIEAKCPIIPMFTENLRESFRTFAWPLKFWEAIYNRIRFPCVPLYGGFPVKLITHLGEPINAMPDETPEELAGRVQKAIEQLIQRHQRIPGNILRALLDRIHHKDKIL